MEGRSDSVDRVWFSIKTWLMLISRNIQKASVVSTMDGAILKELGISVFFGFRHQPVMILWT